MKKLFRSISLIIALILALLLLISVANAYINPAKMYVFTLMGLVFYILWIMNLLFLIWLIFRKRRWFFIPLIVLIITLNHWNNTFQFRGKKIKNESELENPIKIMSFNVHMFDFYNHSGSNETPEIIYDFILKHDPDIICIQEFYSNITKPLYNPAYIMARFKMYQHKHIEYFYKSHSGTAMATFSKFPLGDKGEIRYNSTSNMSMYTDINVRGQMIRVFNNHLESFGLIDNDLEAFDNFDFRMDDAQKVGLRKLLRKLIKAFVLRAIQAEIIAEHIKNSPYPVIVCGDFNDTPVSYVYRTISGNLKDSFRASGAGFGGTYNGKLPSFRIDYILHSPQFDSYNFKKFNFDYSDHFPIMVTIDLKK